VYCLTQFFKPKPQARNKAEFDQKKKHPIFRVHYVLIPVCFGLILKVNKFMKINTNGFFPRLIFIHWH